MRFSVQASSKKERVFFSELIEMLLGEKTFNGWSKSTGKNLKVRVFFLGFEKPIFFFLSSTKRELNDLVLDTNFLRKGSSISLTPSLKVESHVMKTSF